MASNKTPPPVTRLPDRGRRPKPQSTGKVPDAQSHIRLTLPVGSICSSAGDWFVVQYGPDLLQCFNRFTGEPMPHDQLRELMKPPEEYSAEHAIDGVVPEAGDMVLLDKAGRPLSGVQPAVVLAKPGPAMLELVNKGKAREE